MIWHWNNVFTMCKNTCNSFCLKRFCHYMASARLSSLLSRFSSVVNCSWFWIPRQLTTERAKTYFTRMAQPNQMCQHQFSYNFSIFFTDPYAKKIDKYALCSKKFIKMSLFGYVFGEQGFFLIYQNFFVFFKFFYI